MVCLNLPTLCLLTLPLLALSVPAPAVVPASKLSAPLGYHGMKMYGGGGYGPGAMAYGKYGGAYGSGLPGYGAMGIGSPYGGIGPYGLGAGKYGMGAGQYGMGAGGQYGMGAGGGYLYGKSAMYGGLAGGLAATGKLGYTNPLHMLKAMKTYGGGAGYMNQPYGMYPTMGKQYGAVAGQFPGYLGSGPGMYGKYAAGGGAAYMKHTMGPGLAGIGGGYGKGYPPGYMTPYGGKQMGGYGPMGYAAAKQVVPAGYGSVGMLGKALTPYG